MGANSEFRKDDDLSLPWSSSSFDRSNLATCLLVEHIPHAVKGERVFSRRGVMRRAFVLACCMFLGALFTYPAISGNEDADRSFTLQTGLTFLFFTIWCIVMNETKARIWPRIYPVVACSSVACWGSILMHVFQYGTKFAVFAFTCTVVIFIGCVTWFRFISDRIRSRVVAWSAIASSVVLPSYSLCLLTGGDRLMMLLVCIAMGAVGALGFMQNLWATDYCAGDNRDARFEWHMAWLMAFNSMIVFVAITRGTEAVGE